MEAIDLTKSIIDAARRGSASDKTLKAIKANWKRYCELHSYLSSDPNLDSNDTNLAINEWLEIGFHYNFPVPKAKQ